MRKLMLAVLLLIVGTAQAAQFEFCVVDQYGNELGCYFDRNLCLQQARMLRGMCVVVQTN